DGFVLFEAVALEAEALGQLLDLADQDEVDVLLAEVALALRAVDGAVLSVFNEVENELSFALRTLEDFGKHGLILCCDCATSVKLPNAPLPAGEGGAKRRGRGRGAGEKRGMRPLTMRFLACTIHRPARPGR